MTLRIANVNDIPFVVFPAEVLENGGYLSGLEDVGGVIGGGCELCEVLEGYTDLFVMSVASLRIVDNDLVANEKIVLEVEVDFGTVSLRNVGKLGGKLTFIAGDGGGDKVLKVEGRIEDLNEALGGLVYLSDLNFNSEFGAFVPGGVGGLDSVRITVEDDFGGVSVNILRIDVKAVNDSPVMLTGQSIVDDNATKTLHFGDGLSALRMGVEVLVVGEDVPVRMQGVSVRDVDCEQSE